MNRSPEITKRSLKMDANGVSYDFIFSRHPKFRDFLCLGPSHMPKAKSLAYGFYLKAVNTGFSVQEWKKQLRKLNLPKDAEKKLLMHIWNFGLQTHLCELHELDAEWEGITRLAFQLAKCEQDEDLIRIPDEIRLGQPAGLSQPKPNGQIIAETVSEVLAGMVDEIVSDNDSEVDDDRSLEMLEAELQEHGVEAFRSSKSVDQARMAAMKRLQSRIRNRKFKVPTARRSKHMISEVFRNIYRWASLWVQRLACLAFTQQRKSSSWSEAQNSALRKLLDGVPMLSTLDVYINRIDTWLREQCEKAYKENLPKEWKVNIFRPKQIAVLRQYISNRAIKMVVDRSIRAFHNFTFTGEVMIPLQDLSFAVQSAVSYRCKLFDIDLEEMRFYQCQRTDEDSSEECKDSRDPVDEASKAVNKSILPVVAIYFPRTECKIKFLNFPDQFKKGIAFFCPCMETTASGVICAHLLAWVHGRPGERKFIENIVFLTDPFYIHACNSEEFSASEPVSSTAKHVHQLG